MLLMIDNYDSFTFTLVNYLQSLSVDVRVNQNDQITVDEIVELAPRGLMISPGPCTPNESGISMSAIQYFAGVIPIFGVCLGHQAIGQVFGADIVKAGKVMHGKTSQILHAGQGVFNGLKNPLTATRYHSLVVNKQTLPDCFEVTAWTESDNGDIEEIMAMRHKELDIESVQFHPESVLSEQGIDLLANFAAKL